jgi:hypothetical protein
MQKGGSAHALPIVGQINADIARLSPRRLDSGKLRRTGREASSGEHREGWNRCCLMNTGSLLKPSAGIHAANAAVLGLRTTITF